MRDSKRQQSERKPATGMPKRETADERDRAKADPTPGELVEGEGSPGLTITGGGGHA